MNNLLLGALFETGSQLSQMITAKMLAQVRLNILELQVYSGICLSSLQAKGTKATLKPSQAKGTKST